MASKLKSTILFVLILLNIQMFGQEMLGLGFSNYSGISGKNINPAFLTGSKVYLDIHLVGAGISVENNFAYIPKGNGTIWSILRGDSLPEKYGQNGIQYFYTYHKNKPHYNIAGMATIMGPGVMLQDGKQAFGISVSLRNYESGYHIPGSILRNSYDQGAGGNLHDEHSLKKFSAASLSWAELSFNYAYDFYERYGNKLTAGIELKVLYGVEGSYINMRTLKYHWQTNDLMQIDTLNASVGMALPIDYSREDSTNLNPWAKGHGLGFNIGFLYTKEASNVAKKGEKALCAKPYEDYKYRIGVSILDVGGIHFKNNARLYQFQTGNVTLDANQIKFYNTVDSTMNYYSQLLNGNAAKTLTDSTISMSLPAALSL